MKRSRTPDSEEDSYDEQDLAKDGCPSQSYHISDRKKRRGVIEKRRRDRINNSLCELRRLVPAAFEKQGSAKLEKAEILQMTVDHLKLLHSKGIGGCGGGGYGGVDSATVSLDYRLAGFRECASEVARYLVSVEGLDLQDPLRLRLMSHLQCYCAQREAAAVAKATMQNAPWNHVTNHPGLARPSLSNSANHYGHSTTTPLAPPGAMGQRVQPSMVDPSGYVDHPKMSHHVDGGGSVGPGHGHAHPAMRLPVSSVGGQMQGATSGSGSMLPGLPAVHTQFMPVLSPNGLQYHSASSSSPSSSSNLLGQGVKPYRPWGAELVY